MQTAQSTQKSKHHVQSAILHVLAHTIIAFLMKTSYDKEWEVPQAEIDPGNNHISVEEETNSRLNVDG